MGLVGRIGCSFFLAATATACSLPLPGGLDGYQREIMIGFHSRNETKKNYRRIVPGVDLRANLDWGGFHVGWSDLRRLNPVETEPENETMSPPDSDALSFAFPLALTWTKDGAKKKLGWFVAQWPASDPECSFTHHVALGLGVVVGRIINSLTIGISSESLISADLDLDRHYEIEYASRNPGSGYFKVRKKGNEG